MSFLDSFSEIHQILASILGKVFERLLEKEVIGLLHRVESVNTVKLQLELFKQVNPRRDIQQSCFRLFNMWKEDQEPSPVEIDTLSRYSVPYYDPTIDRGELLSNHSIENVDISILDDSRPLTKAEEPPKIVESAKKNPKRPLTAKYSASTKNEHLIPLKLHENDSIEIQMMREKKLNSQTGSVTNKTQDCPLQSKSGTNNTQKVRYKAARSKGDADTALQRHQTQKPQQTKPEPNNKTGFGKVQRPSTAAIRRQ